MSRSPLIAVLATLAWTTALAIPAMARADVEPKVEGSVLTVEGDEDDDTITLTVDGGVLAVNGTATALAADSAAEIVVNAGDGRDLIDAGALADGDYGQMSLHGDGGNDVVVGGGGTDSVFGDRDDDRLLGLGSLDSLRGGEGEDVMVWNDGDGPDLFSGELGIDEAEINGSSAAGDHITYAPVPGPFEEMLVTVENSAVTQVELSAERLTINGLGGPDFIHSADENETVSDRTRLTLIGGGERDLLLGDAGPDVAFGGTGSDDIALRGGPDTMSGGIGDDLLFGQDGDDRLLGDGGDDFLAGEADDDALVWNDGDGSDEFEGAGGVDRAEFIGAPVDGDAFSLAKEGFDTKLRRTNLEEAVVEFVNTGVGNNRPHGGIEAVSIDGVGGEDTFTAGAGLAGLLVMAQGGPGNDTLEGSEEEDSFFGGTGEDTIDPGEGSDLVDGQEGDDELFSVDGVADLVGGGSGVDSAQADAANVDAVAGVEDLDRPPLDQPDGPKQPDKAKDPVQPPVGDTRALLPQLGKVAVTRKGNALFARVPLSCPAAETGGCAASVTLQTAAAVRLGKVKAPLVLGSKGLTLAAGQRRTAAIRLAPGAEEIALRRGLRVRLRLDSSDAAGNSATSSVVLNLMGGAT